MDYEAGYVYDLMDKGGPTYVTEPYFKEAVDEMMRARTLCAKANACMPDDPTYVTYLEETVRNTVKRLVINELLVFGALELETFSG